MKTGSPLKMQNHLGKHLLQGSSFASNDFNINEKMTGSKMTHFLTEIFSAPILMILMKMPR